jgi:hypothetical protein
MKISEILIIEGYSDYYQCNDPISLYSGDGYGDGDCGDGSGNGDSGFDTWNETAHNCSSDCPDDDRIEDKNFGLASLF